MQKVLIANRGEIALRIIRACRELGLKTVAVYSTADRDSLHVRFADEAVCIGPPAPRDSYLRIDRIISAAEVTGADAIHPGYGFLSEKEDFARICGEHNITFIGPTPEVIAKMGHKSVAKETMIKAGVPVVPGSGGLVPDVETGKAIAAEIGYPVIVKAAAGGGGRGMRIVWDADQFGRQFDTAKNEAEAAFGDGSLYVEKFVVNPRHVEIQIMADRHGNVAHLSERECSIQRRHQKLLEESPSPILNADIRKKMGDAAVNAAAAVNYEGAGTVEFLVDAHGDFYFIEMNTRIQVEHPVTELVTGTDLIAEQLSVAMGQPLSFSSRTPNGHAIEFRINAENPFRGFSPSPGNVKTYHTPGGPGIRVDSHVYAGYQIPPHYDSMIAKLIVHAPNRIAAIERGKRALEEFVIEGVHTPIPVHLQLLEHPKFIAGDFDTHFLDSFEMIAPVS
jgi:acetyl-CoA carboxylase biotin carboxylase subunit